MGLQRSKTRYFLWCLWFVSLCGAQTAFSASEGAHGGGHGSITDLLAPGVNFIILVGFIAIKLKGTLKNYFEHYSQSVRLTSERAEAKAKEAQLKYQMFEKKIKTCDIECENISKHIDNEIANFAKNYRQEILEKSERLKSDALQRLEKEKSDSLQQLQEEFLNLIISKASTKIKGDEDIQNKINKKILKVIGL